MTENQSFDKLRQIAQILRSKDGCPWDREQNSRSTLNDLLEECYEFFDAVHKNDIWEMREELGDLFWLVIFQCQLASEEGYFSVEEVLSDACKKLIRRHPHVFENSQSGKIDLTLLNKNSSKSQESEDILKTWEKIKQNEKGKESRKSVLDGIPKALPALYLAEKIQKKTSRFGFDWSSVLEPLKKVEEEIKEFREAIESGASQEEISLEFGDILFALVNAARHSNISAEDALRASITKFSKRFNFIENHFGYDSDKLRSAGLKKLDNLWNAGKAAEKAKEHPHILNESLPEMDEGYIKYNSEHKNEKIDLPSLADYLIQARDYLFTLGLVGVYDNGIGFGNCSFRLDKTNEFIITGSATGQIEHLEKNHLCLVESFDIEKNSVCSIGQTPASSESMTHGAVYLANDKINCVLHIHSRKLFDYMKARDFHFTAENIPYGTPQMANAVMDEVRKIAKPNGIIVMLGHDEGIIAFGQDIKAALSQIENVLNVTLQTPY